MTNKTKAPRRTDILIGSLSLLCLVVETALEGLLWGCLNFKGEGGESNSYHEKEVDTTPDNSVKIASLANGSVKNRIPDNNFSKNEVGV
jgi:hypothetical protein